MSARFNFFIKHLSLSLIVATLVLGWIFTVWYPSPLAKATGVTHIVLLMLAIDVIVGPILGFIVYNQKAKERLLSIGVPEEKIKINTTYYF